MRMGILVVVALAFTGCGIRALGGIPSKAEVAAERCEGMRAKAAAEPSSLVPADTWSEEDARDLMYDLQFHIGSNRDCLAHKIQETFTLAAWRAFACDPKTGSAVFSDRTKDNPRIKELRAQCASESKARTEDALTKGWRRVGE